jgi:hypothetical protein
MGESTPEWVTFEEIRAVNPITRWWQRRRHTHRPDDLVTYCQCGGAYYEAGRRDGHAVPDARP